MSLIVWLPLDGDLTQQGTENTTFSGTPAWKTYGKIGNAALNLQNRITCTTTTLNGVQFFSVTFWARIENNPDSTANWMDVIGFTDQTSSGTNGQFRFETGYGNSAYSGVHWHDNATNAIINGSYTYNTGTEFDKWHHIAVTVSDTEVCSYYDGILKSTITTNLNKGHLTGAWWLGESTTRGCIQDVRIYDYALSAAEVKEISQGLVLHYKLDGGVFGNSNLVLGSNTAATSTNKWLGHSATGGNTSTVEYDGDTPCIKVTRDNVAQSSWDYLSYDRLLQSQIKTNTSYTITFDCKPDVDGSISFTGFVNGNATNYLTASTTNVQNNCYANKWNHMVYKCTTKSSFDGLTIGGQVVYFSRSTSLRAVNISVLFKNIKVEEGDAETPWCPADSELDIDRTIIEDNSGHNHNGALTGSINMVTDTPKYTCATNFPSGTGVHTQLNLTLSQFTISFWGKHTTINKMLMGSNISPTSTSTAWYWYGDNSFKFPSGEFYYSHNAGSAESLLNKWVHFVATYDGTKITIYRNGINEGTKAFTGDQILEYLSVGNGLGTGYRENGYISDFRIYCTALSADDILELYHTGAKVNNLGGIHTYEFVESESPKITKTGIHKNQTFYEKCTLISGAGWTYSPSGANNSCAGNLTVELSDYADLQIPIKLIIEGDISWTNITPNGNGTFAARFQGNNQKIDGTWAWEGTNYVHPGTNQTSAMTSATTGSQHFKVEKTIPAFWFNTYKSSHVSYRTDYATGTITLSNFSVTVAFDIAKIKSNVTIASNFIEL